MKNILFRADSSSKIGTGHIMRDIVLAKQFQDENIIFATQDLPGNINYKIEEAGYKIVSIKSNDIQELQEYIENYDIDLIVIDHYEIDQEVERQLKIHNSKLKIMSLDDTYEKHYCDILLNHNIYADTVRYKGLVPDHCELRCGEKYTLLRNEFIEEKQLKKKLKATERKIIFVAMGGTDAANLNPKIIEVLENFENIEVHIVTTTANPNLKELEQFVMGQSWIYLHINSTKIARLMAKSDFAIVTPSVIMNEVWYLNIPFIAIKVADNQVYMYQYLKEKNKLVLEEFDSIVLQECVKQLSRSRNV